jgi:hypothetical protein
MESSEERDKGPELETWEDAIVLPLKMQAGAASQATFRSWKGEEMYTSLKSPERCDTILTLIKLIKLQQFVTAAMGNWQSVEYIRGFCFISLGKMKLPVVSTHWEAGKLTNLSLRKDMKTFMLRRWNGVRFPSEVKTGRQSVLSGPDDSCTSFSEGNAQGPGCDVAGINFWRWTVTT